MTVGVETNVIDRSGVSLGRANLLSAAEAAGRTHSLFEVGRGMSRFGRLDILIPFAGEGLSARACRLPL